MDPKLYERYSRQILFADIGEEGQKRLLQSSVVLVGCGALGTVSVGLLLRAGVGSLRIVDRDFVEMSNLQRQGLFEESDAQESLPKAVAAERRLRAINSDAKIEGLVSDLTPKNARELLTGFSLILDGTDNFESRLLINDAAISLKIPWIYAAAVGSYGLTFTVRPEATACLACLAETGDGSQGDGFEETCDTAGILNGAASVVASIQATEAIKILSGNSAALSERLVSCDVWKNRFQSIGVARNPSCRACALHKFTYLEGEAQPHVTMCGRDSVQIHERSRRLDLAELSRRLERSSVGVRSNDFLLRFQIPPYEVTVFSDGRAVVKGTQDPAVARSLYARYVGA
ncbi:MAG TPA: ThiF family adenylyltransferase [Candidatus Acidoferrales bacterium]|nr:ThiF family adenylyltransferase [Candidatus Acidoferrales bacterium]